MGMPVIFDDHDDKIRYTIDPSVPHFAAEYHALAQEAGLLLEELRGLTVTPELARAFAHVGGREGFPLLLALRLRRTG